ncbi:hypothetical protein ALC60_01392 [Trachymyrmex zeteki]|uniref:Uncharacterized protein n=1 Tax=Mycetomoellerius zeteki TaxID=64791 RepID=A0A151XGP9_9HYME|nr:hypothetical protein ALC60_01392 [Trachymyrmex zeteki]
MRRRRWGTPESTMSEAVAKRRANFLSDAEEETCEARGSPGSTQASSTATPRTLAYCPECPEVLEKFVAYLNRTGEQLWNDPESTVIGISSARL